MARNNQRQLLTIGIIGVAIIALFVIGPLGFNVLETPDCTFETAGDTCTYDVTIPANREISTLTLDLDFGSVPEAEYTMLPTLSYTDTAFTQADSSGSSPTYEDQWHYLYKLPPNLGEIEAVRVGSTITGSCSSPSNSKAELDQRLGGVSVAYPSNTISIVSDRSNAVEDTLLAYYRQSDGDWATRNYATSFASGESWDCNQNEALSGQSGRLTGTWTSLPAHDDSSEVAVLITKIQDLQPSGTMSSSGPTDVTFEIKRALYPEDVSYRVGSVLIDTLSGEQKDSIKTIEFGDVVNRGCQRPSVSESCTVPVTITSQSPGKMWINPNLELSTATQETPVFDDPVEDGTPTDGDTGGSGEEPLTDPRASGSTNDDNSESPTVAPEGNWFTRLLDSIASFFTGLFTI